MIRGGGDRQNSQVFYCHVIWSRAGATPLSFPYPPPLSLSLSLSLSFPLSCSRKEEKKDRKTERKTHYFQSLLSTSGVAGGATGCPWRGLLRIEGSSQPTSQPFLLNCILSHPKVAPRSSKHLRQSSYATESSIQSPSGLPKMAGGPEAQWQERIRIHLRYQGRLESSPRPFLGTLKKKPLCIFP